MGSGVASVDPAGGTSILKNSPVLCSRMKAPQTTGPENLTLGVSTGPWEIAQWPWWQWWRAGLEVTWVIALGTWAGPR